MPGFTPGGAYAPEQMGPAQPPAWLNQLPSNENPFAARLRENPELAVIGPGERARLDATDSFYRGTVMGSTHLTTLGLAAAGKPIVDPGKPHPYLTQNRASRTQPDPHDLARYDSMPCASAARCACRCGAHPPELFLHPRAGSPLSRSRRAAAWLGSRFRIRCRVRRARQDRHRAGSIQLVTDPVAQAALITGIDPKQLPAHRLGSGDGAIFGGLIAGHEVVNWLTQAGRRVFT